MFAMRELNAGSSESDVALSLRWFSASPSATSDPPGMTSAIERRGPFVRAAPAIYGR